MSSRLLTYFLLLVVSVAVGVFLGEWFYHLFLQAVPPVALSNFNSQSSRIAHWLYGAGVGIVLFGWALLGMAVHRILQLLSKPKAKT